MPLSRIRKEAGARPQRAGPAPLSPLPSLDLAHSGIAKAKFFYRGTPRYIEAL